MTLGLSGLLATTALTAAHAAPVDPTSGASVPAATSVADGAPASAPDQPVELGGVVVTGRLLAIDKSIRAKRHADVVSDGFSSDEISSIPEFGLGDALARVPGVVFQINNGRGEDQFMTLRGLNGDYGSTTVDGVALATSEETTRQTSFDILPSVLVKSVDVYKTWTVDQPSDAISGVTELHTRSAFDHPGLFVSGHLDGAYWENERELHPNQPSGQGDFTISKTFGPEDHFGVLLLGSFYTRSSNTLNTYTLPWTYYQASGAGNPMSPVSLTPSSSVNGLIGVPNTHRWYFYDNVRTRPGLFTKLEYNDNQFFHAALSGGVFEHLNDENRYSNYLTKGTGAVVTETTPTTGSVSTGKADIDYDRYFQYRQLSYVDLRAGVNLSEKTHLDLDINYGFGHYRQNTIEDQFLTASSANYGYTYNLNAPTSPLFFPNNPAAIANLANYTQQYHATYVDASHSTLPQYKLDFKHNVDADDRGLGFKAGLFYRDLGQSYYFDGYKTTPTGAAPTLGAIGVLKTLHPDNGEGQGLIPLDPEAVTTWIKAHPGGYLVNPVSSVNDYQLKEKIAGGYAEARYRADRFLVIAGLRYEQTKQDISTYLPNFGSTITYNRAQLDSTYARLLPSLNASYDFTDRLKMRAAITQTYARPQYAQLAESSSASTNVNAGLAIESIANPNLKPRLSTNYDWSLEWYPHEGVQASLAIFDKEIDNEIITVTNTIAYSNPSLPTVTQLQVSQAQNAGHASVNGVELSLIDERFDFLPGPLKHFGASANATFLNMDAPNLGSRKLPQLLNSAKNVVNASVFYTYGPFFGEVAFNHTGKLPISFDSTNAVNDQWWAAIDTVDAQLRYKVNDHFFVRLQGKNLTNAEPQKVVGPNQALNYSTLDNGRAYWAGVGFNF